MSTQNVPHIIGGEHIHNSAGKSLPVTNPATGEVIARVPLGGARELEDIVQKASKAQKSWGETPIKERVQVLFRAKSLIEQRSDQIAKVINLENGKTKEEALASIARAIECVEFATSLPQISPGQVLEVSKGVECKMLRFPLGVVAAITPFNFPFMVPMWMIPLALGLGNAVVLKPSEQTPLSSIEIANIFKDAGLPAGVFSVIHGEREVVEAICDHPEIRAIGFVGSTKVAKIVYERGTSSGKRVRSLGGAKNHLVVVPDADPEMAASNIVASVTGCCGQRCMAASVLLAVGDVDNVISLVKAKMQALIPGRDIGPIINRASLEKIQSYLARAEEGDAEILLDGRKARSEGSSAGNFIGPSIIDYATPKHEAALDEIFGPVLTIIRCDTLEEAIQAENANPYGNAAAIYTSSGEVAMQFMNRASAGMIGVNIGVPVPREPFAFGGWNDSRFGDGDITGIPAIDFWSLTKKVTTKWTAQSKSNWMS